MQVGGPIGSGVVRTLELAGEAVTPLAPPVVDAAASIAAARINELVMQTLLAIKTAPSRPMRVLEINGALEGARLALERAQAVPRVGASAWLDEVRRATALTKLAGSELDALGPEGDAGRDLIAQLARTQSETAARALGKELDAPTGLYMGQTVQANDRARTLLLGWLADRPPGASTNSMAAALANGSVRGPMDLGTAVTALTDSAMTHLDDAVRTQNGVLYADPATKRGLAVQRVAQAYRDMLFVRELVADVP